MWVPGGYIVYILMTWCPGVVLLDFWSRDPAERQVIRNAFKIAYEYVCYLFRLFIPSILLQLFANCNWKIIKGLSKMFGSSWLPRMG
jgi:hypothetical protein